jgi:hypothetical protein
MIAKLTRASVSSSAKKTSERYFRVLPAADSTRRRAQSAAKYSRMATRKK